MFVGGRPAGDSFSRSHPGNLIRGSQPCWRHLFAITPRQPLDSLSFWRKDVARRAASHERGARRAASHERGALGAASYKDGARWAGSRRFACGAGFSIRRLAGGPWRWR